MSLKVGKNLVIGFLFLPDLIAKIGTIEGSDDDVRM